jgi:hypothetical protein
MNIGDKFTDARGQVYELVDLALVFSEDCLKRGLTSTTLKVGDFVNFPIVPDSPLFKVDPPRVGNLCFRRIT